MSYHLPAPRRRTGAPTRPPLYALDAFGAVVPLSQVPPTQPSVPSLENAAIRKLIVAAVVVAAVVALIWWINEQRKKVGRNPARRRRASRQSTREMARNLHRRLEKQGGANERVMRSLAQLGSDA